MNRWRFSFQIVGLKFIETDQEVNFSWLFFVVFNKIQEQKHQYNYTSKTRNTL